MSRANLPSFGKPPVIETVVGIQFDPIPGFTNNHLGAFWARLGGRKTWPFSADAQPLRPEFERFGDEQQWVQADTVMLGLTPIPMSRMQLRNQAGDRMLQLQNGRLIYNWLGANGAEYPRYRQIRPEFDKHFEEFRSFLLDENLLAMMRQNQWDVTYVNHIPKGTVWNSVEDWSQVFQFHAVPPAVLNVSRLESVAGNWMYEITPRRGRLRVQLQHAKIRDSSTETLVFTLTARGPIGEGEGGLDRHEAGLDLGHEVIVNSFRDLTSAKARKYWEER